MRKATKQALAGWQAEAERVRKEREGDPNAFTAAEFAEVSHMSVEAAGKYIQRCGKYRRTKKVVGGRLHSAWVEA